MIVEKCDVTIMGGRHSHHYNRRIYESRLHRAVYREDVATTKYLISKGYDLNAVDNSISALNVAVNKKSRKMMDILIRSGADMNQSEGLNIPAIHQIIYSEQIELLQIMLQTGCNVNLRWNKPTAADKDHNESNTSYAAAPATSVDEDGFSPLVHCVMKNNLHMAKLVLQDKDCKVNAVTKNGRTALMIAIIMNHPELVRLLLQSDSDVNVADNWGRTALIHAVNRGELSTVRHLVEEHHCRVNCADAVGMTPLMYAATNGNYCLVAYLISMGSHTNWKDNRGQTALSCAAMKGSTYCVETILKKGATASIDIQDVEQGRTPLYLAASKGHVGVVRSLVSKEANLFIPTKDGKSPLYVASYFGHEEIVKILLEAKADTNQTDSHGKTPLYVATYHDHPTVVRMLLNVGASVNMTDRNGKTPLYVAVNHGNYKIAEMLIKGGANLDTPDIEGLCPLSLAVKFPKLDIPMVKLLINSGCDPMNLDKFIDWLVEKEIIPEGTLVGDQEFYKMWMNLKKMPRPLKQQCRELIQNQLGSVHHGLKRKLVTLPLPTQLQDYLKVKPL